MKLFTEEQVKFHLERQRDAVRQTYIDLPKFKYSRYGSKKVKEALGCTDLVDTDVQENRETFIFAEGSFGLFEIVELLIRGEIPYEKYQFIYSSTGYLRFERRSNTADVGVWEIGVEGTELPLLEVLEGLGYKVKHQ